MALTEQTKFFVGVLDDGQIELRKTRVILDGTDVVGEKHHRQVLEPGQDVQLFPLKIRDICAVVWTPEVIADFERKRAAQRSLEP
jgi:hypothetical protein